MDNKVNAEYSPQGDVSLPRLLAAGALCVAVLLLICWILAMLGADGSGCRLPWQL